ncbi:MAG: glycosyltransferase [Bacteroidales bacterium]|jgi:glycosyltransferase involved in cell wall biosynthesis|nr:glycosyltransferase [Bacteroidales bacterium]
MWWLILPVIIYSAGLLVLWLLLIRHDKYAVFAQEASSLPGVSVVAFETGKAGRTGSMAAVAVSESLSLPVVSVVVAARNEEKHITNLLDNLFRQDYPENLLEIIIVNDNSTDRTPVVVSEYISARVAGSETAARMTDPGAINVLKKNLKGPRTRLIYNPYIGKKRAVRYGIEKASGEVIITTDADCVVGPEWVSSHASWYTKGGPDMVLAPVVQKPAGGFWSLFGVYEFSALQAITEATALAGHPVMCNAANLSFRRDVYLRHADKLHHDLASGDDMFLLQAVMRDGGTVRHDGRSAAAVVTAAAVTAAALLRQRARWASKTFRYRDAATLTLAAATAACTATVAAAVVAAFMAVEYLPLAAAMYAIKSVPDYLIIAGEMKKRGNRIKGLSFMAAEIIYPFWFLTVGIVSLLPGSGRFGKR